MPEPTNEKRSETRLVPLTEEDVLRLQEAADILGTTPRYPTRLHSIASRYEDGIGGMTHSVQRDVEDFHRALDMPIGESPAIRRPELRAELIREEARETVEAIERGDLVEAIDGMCDVLCVVYGAAAEFGIDLAPFWDEVHRTNMAKQGGPVREDGKRLKPEGWQPPDIAGILDDLKEPAPRKEPDAP